MIALAPPHDSKVANVDVPALCCSLALGAAVALTYAGSFRGAFVFDDHGAILDNNSISPLTDLRRVLTGARFATVVGRPVLNLSLAIDYALHGEDPWGYHSWNVLSHILATWVLFGVLRRMFELPACPEFVRDSATSLAFASALLWALHPLQTSAVTYICQRGESLVGLCYLLTLYCVIRGATGRNPTSWYVLAVIACYVGTGTKEVMATAPLVLFCFDRTFLAGSFARSWSLRRSLYLGLISSWILVAVLVLSSNQRGGSAGFGLGVSPERYLWTQAWYITRYLRLCFWPDPLIADYGKFLVASLPEALPYVGFVGTLVAATIWTFWRRPMAGFPGIWFFAILGPTSSIVPLAGQTGAEHRMYLPLAAVIAGSVIALHWFVRRAAPTGTDHPPVAMRQRIATRAVSVISLTLAVCLAWGTVRRNRVYADEFTFWEDVLHKMPQNERGPNGCATACMDSKDFARAVDYYDQALRLNPDFSKARGGRGMALVELGRYDEGIAELTRAILLDRNSLLAWIELCRTYGRAGRSQEALFGLQELEKKFPKWDRIPFERGVVLRQLGDSSGALRQFNRALEQNPKSVDARLSRADLLAAQGDLETALRDVTLAIEVRPRSPELYLRRAKLELQLRRPHAAQDDIDRCRQLGGAIPDDLAGSHP